MAMTRSHLFKQWAGISITLKKMSLHILSRFVRGRSGVAIFKQLRASQKNTKTERSTLRSAYSVGSECYDNIQEWI